MNIFDLEAQYATQVIKYQALLEQGALTQEEYQELVFDLLDARSVKSDLDTEADKIAAEKVIKSLIALAGVIPK